MSDNIPFEILLQIMKRLTVKSLVQFRSVCKTWKSVIDSADFVNDYSGHTQHLLARYKDRVDFDEKYVLIADDHNFPHHKVFPTIHPFVKMLNRSMTIGCSHGLLCLYGDYQVGHDGPVSGTGRAVVWNPCIQKAVVVDVPNVADKGIYDTVLGFGVCGETIDPKIVKITHFNKWGILEGISCNIPWQVEVFTLSTKAWRSPYGTKLPRKSIEFYEYQVLVGGVLYWLATDSTIFSTDYFRWTSYNLIISFDLTSEEFSEVSLPDIIARQCIGELSMFKLRESVVVLERDVEDGNVAFHVWMMEDGLLKLFTKLFTIVIPDAFEVWVVGFRKTGEPIIDSAPRYPEWTGSPAVYDPFSKSISNIGINENFSNGVYSYIDTLLLL